MRARPTDGACPRTTTWRPTPARAHPRDFGQRRTLAIGAAFGVITVLGPKGEGQIDVATFRRDAAYSDGRHPDAVTFRPEDDAQRRDFTINGLFYDPLDRRVIDYVGGQDDLARRHPGDRRSRQRIAEDKLRMLRAVRFAARFDFTLDAATLAAIKQQARELVIVSAKRSATEFRLILTHSSRARGVELLSETAACWRSYCRKATLRFRKSAWDRTRATLAGVDSPTFAMSLAALLREIAAGQCSKNLSQLVFDRWKLSTDELPGVEKLLREEPFIRAARQQPWPKLQRILIAPRIEELIGYCESVARVLHGTTSETDFCRAKLALPDSELNPPPLITGDDLKSLGIPPGPAYRDILEAARDAQLNKTIMNSHEALKLAATLYQQGRS